MSVVDATCLGAPLRRSRPPRLREEANGELERNLSGHHLHDLGRLQEPMPDDAALAFPDNDITLLADRCDGGTLISSRSS